MSPDSAQAFGVALMALWGTAGAVALGRSVAKSPSARELAAAIRKMNLAAKGALVAGLVGAVAIGGTKPGGSDPQRLGQRPLSVTRTIASTNAPPFALIEVRTNGVALVAASTNAIISESFRRRGTSEGGEWIETDAPFFRWDTNPVSRVFASLSVLSFGTMRHPALCAALPDGSPAESLVALRTPLGLAPEANWTRLVAPSRFWHEETAFGRVFTWENALLDRQADRPATIQIETWDDGEFAFRYDFSAATPTNGFFAGAQFGPAAIEALGVRGSITNAATVYRVNGAPVQLGVSVSDLLTSPHLELRWKNVAGLGDLSGDTDGDGLTDWEEVFLHDTSPILTDTDYDGLSDVSELALGYSPNGYDMDDDGLVDGIDPNPLVWNGDGFGTSLLWVQCSFGNAAEINAEGYDNYVLRITGGSPSLRTSELHSRSSSQSRYRKLFELDVSAAAISGDQRVRVGVGEKTIVLRSGGTYRFALEKGREYELVTDAPNLVSFSSPDSEPIIVQPTRTGNGRVFWRASGIEVTPAAHHFYLPGDECEFSALCLDCHPANATDWSWSCSDPRLSLTSCGSTNCIVTWLGPSVSWGCTTITVSFNNLGRTISESVMVTFGDNSEPQTSIGIGFPSAFFAESESPVPLVVFISQDNPTEGMLTLSAVDGGANIGVSSDLAGVSGVSLPLEVPVPAQPFFAVTNYVVASAPSTRVGATRFDVEFSSGDFAIDGDSVQTTAIRVDGVSVPSAPSSGLSVLSGTSIGLSANLTPAGSATLVETDWLLARRKSDGSYHAWTSIASGVPGGAHSHCFQQSGIFAIRADVSCANETNTVYYQRTVVGPYDYDRIEPWNHIGVASTQAQLDLRNFAVAQLGRTDFAKDAILPSMNGFSSLPSPSWKCNAFVAYCAMSVGQTVPVQHSGSLGLSAYPPTANEWANGSTISGWSFIGSGVDPEPGWICGHPSFAGPGHVGIVDYDGYGIAAGTLTVNRQYWQFLDGSCGYNKFGE